MRITLTEQDGASAVLARIAEKVTSRQPLHAVLGKRAEIELRGHFETRNSEGNKRRWPSQQFWARIRTATAFASADETGARVVINDPAINQKIFGGPIRPQEGKYLAPLRSHVTAAPLKHQDGTQRGSFSGEGDHGRMNQVIGFILLFPLSKRRIDLP